MLELPESMNFAKQMTNELRGKRICKVEVGHTPHRFAFFKGEQERYSELLEGKRIVGAVHRGGLIELQTTDSMIMFGDGAYPRYYNKISSIPKRHQFLLMFDDETTVAVTIQMYGEIGVFELGKCEDSYYLSSSKKPDILGDEFTYEYFRGLYKNKKKMSVKAFLATEQRIPGLGNGVLQDILWYAKLDPRYNMEQLDEEGFQQLYQAVRNTLSKMCRDGGRNTEKDFYHNPGGYITQLSKLSIHEPCMRCGAELHKANYMGGSIYVCEKCQKR